MTNQRMRKQWAPWSLPATTLGPLTEATADLTTTINFAMPSLSNYTVIRSIGNLRFWGLTTAARVSFFVGIIGVNAQAGLPQLPSPATDLADWLFWYKTQLPFSNEQPDNVEVHFDTRGMRRQREADRKVFLIMQNVDAVQSAVVGGGGRLLIGLP